MIRSFATRREIGTLFPACNSARAALPMRYCRACHELFEDDTRECPRDGTPLSAPDPLLKTTIEGKYRIEGLLGTGGMGTVYLATQLALARSAAIKVVRGDYLGDDVVASRFKREALAVARLKHPNIVTIYDFGIVPEIGAFIVME